MTEERKKSRPTIKDLMLKDLRNQIEIAILKNERCIAVMAQQERKYQKEIEDLEAQISRNDVEIEDCHCRIRHMRYLVRKARMAKKSKAGKASKVGKSVKNAQVKAPKGGKRKKS